MASNRIRMRHLRCFLAVARHGTVTAAAEALGQSIAAEHWRLVYGAGDVALMGIVARAAQAGGGETFGVIPAHLVAWEVGKTDLTRYVVTETMHERKARMIDESDALIALPGGMGTYDELFEAMTWLNLGLHDKPIYLLGPADYWQPFLQLLQHIDTEGFAWGSPADLVSYLPNLEALAAETASLRPK